ncbi:MAG: putative zinc-binding metallopeptidase [Vicinamibacteria bacterium]|nr:putative zinc-binding metallopeptidase [Vicinamibacteria bacterium]
MPRAGAQQPTPAPGRALPKWASWPDEDLLELRLCDLGLHIAGTAVEEGVRALYANLQASGLRFRPHVWLSDEWFCPDGVAGIAIPFHLAHSRLMRLERSQMLEVEGGTPEWCLRILRHEAGHAIENAFGLRKRERRIQIFGDSKQPYPAHYEPRPYSRRFVVHLDGSYAQAHPDEDFAETFAVWIDPESDWRADYAGWPALSKLEYVDEVMRELRSLTPPKHRERTVEPLSSLRLTLREHYEARRAHYGVDHPSFHDTGLKRLFRSPSDAGAKSVKAERVIRELSDETARTVARWTGQYQYVIKAVIAAMADRCRHLELRSTLPKNRARLEFATLLTVETMKKVHSGRHRAAL